MGFVGPLMTLGKMIEHDLKQFASLGRKTRCRTHSFLVSFLYDGKHLQQVAAETGRCYREHLAGDVPDRRKAVRMQLITGHRLMGIESNGTGVIMKDEDGDDIIERGKTFEESEDTDTVFFGGRIRSFVVFPYIGCFPC